jgi:Ca-activated chloride channel homolog
MPSPRAKSAARTFLLLALLLGCARAAAAQGAAAATAPTPAAEPVSVVIVVDTSASVESLSGAEGRRFLDSFARFAQAGGGRDEFSVVSVSTFASVSLDRTEDAGEVSKKLSDLFSSREPQATSLYDGCALALKKALGGKHGRRALLVLSDGLDTVSELSLKDVQKLLGESGVRLFAVEVGQRNSVGKLPEGFRALEALAKSSGGAAYRLKKKGGDFDSVLSAVRDAPRR